MRRSKSLILLLLLATALTACARKPLLYEWGSYNQQIYEMYHDPGKVPPEKQLQDLEEDYQEARAADRPVPPGFHAHVGYLYFQLGKIDQALQSFETEKALFPESTVYMDRLIARLKHG
jgi:hypothetical protein